MPRPTNKIELLKAAEKNFQKLLDIISDVEIQEMIFPIEFLNRNVRDVIAHLHHWHLLVISWYEHGMQGKEVHMPEKGYTWKTLPEYNKMVQEKYASIALTDAIDKCIESHAQVLEIISTHSNEELFEKKRFAWTRTTSMGAYFVSSTSSHYDWAIKLIKKAKRLNKAT